MRERYQLFFGLRLVCKEFHHSTIQTKLELHFGGFFHQMKVRQPIGRQDSMQTVIWTSRRLESFLHEAAQNFELWTYQQDGFFWFDDINWIFYVSLTQLLWSFWFLRIKFEENRNQKSYRLRVWRVDDSTNCWCRESASPFQFYCSAIFLLFFYFSLSFSKFYPFYPFIPCSLFFFIMAPPPPVPGISCWKF